MTRKQGKPSPRKRPQSTAAEIDLSLPVAQIQCERPQVELFAEITFKIRQSLQLSEILRTIVTEVQRVLTADRVLIYQVFADNTGKPISEAVLPAYPAILGTEFPEEVFPIEFQQLYAKGRVRGDRCSRSGGGRRRLFGGICRTVWCQSQVNRANFT
jgi:two-component system, OmpR family, sensor histidine kinase VicK